MDILVDPEKSQTENLMYLLEQARIPQTVKNDIEGYSCLARDKTINGKQYNTELHLHILPNSPTHLREKNSYAESNYNRVPVGFPGDNTFGLEHDERTEGLVDFSNRTLMNEKLAEKINRHPKFSQESKFPFRVEVSEDFRSMTVFPSLASPCYYGSKQYRFNVREMVSINSIPTQIYVSRHFFPKAKNQLIGTFYGGWTFNWHFPSNEYQDNTGFRIERAYSLDDRFTGNESVKEFFIKVLNLKNNMEPFNNKPYLIQDIDIEEQYISAIQTKVINFVKDPAIKAAVWDYTLDGFWVNNIWKRGAAIVGEDDIIGYRVFYCDDNKHHGFKSILLQLHIGSVFLRFLKETNREPGKSFTMKNIAGIDNGIPVGGNIELRFTKHLNKSYINTNEFRNYAGIVCKLEALNGQPTTKENMWVKKFFFETIFKEFNEWLYSKFNIRIYSDYQTYGFLSEIKVSDPSNYTSLKNLYNTEDSDYFTMNRLPNQHMFVAGFLGMLFKSKV